MNATASIRRLRNTPRKVRLVADLIRGKMLPEAKAILHTIPKAVAIPLSTLLASAEANAKNGGVSSTDSMKISDIRVDADTVMKRMMPRARGSSAQILKRMSRVSITLSLPVEAKSKKTTALKAKSLKAKS